MQFGSDNQSGVHPQILAAMTDTASGTAPAYGEDDWTQAVTERLSAVFERPCQVFMVATGSAANALALSALCPPWGGIYCHHAAHIINDENTAPEAISGGARQLGIPGEAGKPDPTAIREHIVASQIHGVHNVKPSAISLSNVTEWGAVYTPDEVAEYGAIAREHGLGLHMDGARFANAVVSSDAHPADLTWRAGVDALSFGATKNGAMAAEAAVFFNDEAAEAFAYRRKRFGHLWSKHRFLAAQWLGYLQDDLWLDNARHANTMATALAKGLAAIPGVDLPWAVEANELFPVLPTAIATQLEQAGAIFYPWPEQPGMVRLVTSFATTEEDVAEFLRVASSVIG